MMLRMLRVSFCLPLTWLANAELDFEAPVVRGWIMLYEDKVRLLRAWAWIFTKKREKQHRIPTKHKFHG